MNRTITVSLGLLLVFGCSSTIPVFHGAETVGRNKLSPSIAGAIGVSDERWGDSFIGGDYSFPLSCNLELRYGLLERLDLSMGADFAMLELGPNIGLHVQLIGSRWKLRASCTGSYLWSANPSTEGHNLRVSPSLVLQQPFGLFEGIRYRRGVALDQELYDYNGGADTTYYFDQAYDVYEFILGYVHKGYREVWSPQLIVGYNSHLDTFLGHFALSFWIRKRRQKTEAQDSSRPE